MPKKIFVVVDKGIAETVQGTVPEGYQVEIIDLDAIREGDSFPSREAEQLVFASRYLPRDNGNRRFLRRASSRPRS